MCVYVPVPDVTVSVTINMKVCPCTICGQVQQTLEEDASKETQQGTSVREYYLLLFDFRVISFVRCTTTEKKMLKQPTAKYKCSEDNTFDE